MATILPRGRPQPLVHYIAEQTAQAVTLSFAEMEAIIGRPLPDTMRVNTALWNSGGYALVWRLRALGWRARLDRRSRCVMFTRDVERE